MLQNRSMSEKNTSFIGLAWLCERYALKLVNSKAVTSSIGPRRQAVLAENETQEVYQEIMRPASTARAHLSFHLKHEPIHLEMLSRLFSIMDPAELTSWIGDEPSGQYAKRAGFLYEWLTGRSLGLVQAAGNNVDALDPSAVVVASKSTVNKRWHVRDNMPGTPRFCPVVRLNSATKAAMALDCAAQLDQLKGEFGEDMVLKSAVWLTMRESRASFLMEGEANKKKRIERFADVIHRHTGHGVELLDHAGLAMLQKAILGDDTSVQALGVRQSPVFVGQSVRMENVVHYVAPPPSDLVPMLDGLKYFLEATDGASPVMRCAVASFGFVYIHPMADGNGRVHRFLINDVLRTAGAVPWPLILPVSGLLTRDPVERKAYDDVLDVFSKRLMDQYRDACQLAPTVTTYGDGVASNFEFQANDSARHAWRFMDLTEHVSFMAKTLEKTIQHEMRDEAIYLRRHHAARSLIKEVLEMPDQQIDRVIRSVEQNNGILSGVLLKEIPAFSDAAIWKEVVVAVRSAFEVTQYSSKNSKEPNSENQLVDSLVHAILAQPIGSPVDAMNAAFEAVMDEPINLDSPEHVALITKASGQVAIARLEQPGPQAGRKPLLREEIYRDAITTATAIGQSRKELQRIAKTLGMPATGPTADISRIVQVAQTPPKFWTEEDFGLMAPHLSIYQDVRPGSANRVESIMRDGLKSGMVDHLGSMVDGCWTWGRRLLGGDAYVFVTSQMTFLGNGNPRVAPGNKPLFHFANKPGQNIFSAVTSGSIEVKAIEATVSVASEKDSPQP